MDTVNQFLNAPLLTFGDTVVTSWQILQVLLLGFVGSAILVWSARFVRARMERRAVDPNLVQVISRAWLILGFIILAFVVLDLLSVPLGAFAFVSGAVAICVGFYVFDEKIKS